MSKRRRQDQELGWIVELAYGPFPAGRFWFGRLTKERIIPLNAWRFVHHTQAGGRLRVASSRPVSRPKEDRNG